MTWKNQDSLWSILISSLFHPSESVKLQVTNLTLLLGSNAEEAVALFKEHLNLCSIKRVEILEYYHSPPANYLQPYGDILRSCISLQHLDIPLWYTGGPLQGMP